MLFEEIKKHAAVTNACIFMGIFAFDNLNYGVKKSQ